MTTSSYPPAGGYGGQVQVVAEGAEAFGAAAILALQCRLGLIPAAVQSGIGESVHRLSRAPLSVIAAQCLANAGYQVSSWDPPDQLIEQAMQMDGVEHRRMGADYSPANRPGSFPNILSGLANKILDEGLAMSAPTYEQWTGELQDVKDLKPGPVVAKSQADELDELLDAVAVKDLELAEEMLSFMLVRRFGNKFGLTPVMAANDDLDAFREGLLGLESAWENTVNRGCLNLLAGNVPLLDGYNLFDDTNHGNDRATGGAPSQTEWDAMNLKVSAQRGIGGKGYIRAPLGVVVVPPKHHTAALKTFAPFQMLAETKVAATDDNVNVYRGTATVVREPELQTVSNDVWYGLCKPMGGMNATIVRAYFKGWGKQGRRERWWDPAHKVMNFGLEGRVGMAAKQYRTAVRNSGTGA